MAAQKNLNWSAWATHSEGADLELGTFIIIQNESFNMNYYSNRCGESRLPFQPEWGRHWRFSRIGPDRIVSRSDQKPNRQIANLVEGIEFELYSRQKIMERLRLFFLKSGREPPWRDDSIASQ